MRLFVGIPLPDDIRDRLGALCAGLPKARWVRPENMHVTLRFIGEVDEGQAEDLHGLLDDIAAPAFPVSLAGIGCFERGRGNKVGAVWTGVEAGSAVGHLHEKVESAAVRAGFGPEHRKFKPHITLARLNGTPSVRVGQFIQAHEGFRAGPFMADRFTLFRSHLGREGAHYEALADYALETD
jgi:2'-5' RNA ligase